MWDTSLPSLDLEAANMGAGSQAELPQFQHLKPKDLGHKFLRIGATSKSLVQPITDPWNTDFFTVTHTHTRGTALQKPRDEAFFHITVLSTG